MRMLSTLHRRAARRWTPRRHLRRPHGAEALFVGDADVRTHHRWDHAYPGRASREGCHGIGKELVTGRPHEVIGHMMAVEKHARIIRLWECLHLGRVTKCAVAERGLLLLLLMRQELLVWLLMRHGLSAGTNVGGRVVALYGRVVRGMTVLASVVA